MSGVLPVMLLVLFRVTVPKMTLMMPPPCTLAVLPLMLLPSFRVSRRRGRGVLPLPPWLTPVSYWGCVCPGPGAQVV